MTDSAKATRRPWKLWLPIGKGEITIYPTPEKPGMNHTQQRRIATVEKESDARLITLAVNRDHLFERAAEVVTDFLQYDIIGDCHGKCGKCLGCTARGLLKDIEDAEGK